MKQFIRMTTQLSLRLYTYVCKTDKSSSNTRRQLTVTLMDGTVHEAHFKFK